MRIQGWGASIGSAAYLTVQSRQKKNTYTADDTSECGERRCGESRQEMLETIKKRIKSGFYNSDAVIEDLGHGFAKALDHTL